MSGGALRVEVVCEREHVVWRRAMRMGARRARRGVQACAPVWRDRVEKGGCGEEAGAPAGRCGRRRCGKKAVR